MSWRQVSWGHMSWQPMSWPHIILWCICHDIICHDVMMSYIMMSCVMMSYVKTSYLIRSYTLMSYMPWCQICHYVLIHYHLKYHLDWILPFQKVVQTGRQTNKQTVGIINFPLRSRPHHQPFNRKNPKKNKMTLYHKQISLLYWSSNRCQVPDVSSREFQTLSLQYFNQNHKNGEFSQEISYS